MFLSYMLFPVSNKLVEMCFQGLSHGALGGRLEGQRGQRVVCLGASGPVACSSCKSMSSDTKLNYVWDTTTSTAWDDRVLLYSV